MIKDINFSKQAVEKINQLIAKKPSGTFFRIAVKVVVVLDLNMIFRLIKKLIRMILKTKTLL